MVDAAIHVADVVRQGPRLEAPPPAVPVHVVEDAEELHGGAVRGHPELVGWPDAARHQAWMVVVFEQSGRELPHRGQIRERPAVGDGAVGHLLQEVDEIRRVRLGHGRPAENVVDQIRDESKLGVLKLPEQPVFQQIAVWHGGRGPVDDDTQVGDGGAGRRAKRGNGPSRNSLDAGEGERLEGSQLSLTQLVQRNRGLLVELYRDPHDVDGIRWGHVAGP